MEASEVEVKGVVTGWIRLSDARGRSARDDATVPDRAARLGSPGQTRSEASMIRPGMRGHSPEGVLAMHDDLSFELARHRWRDLQREAARARAVKMARSGWPPRRRGVRSRLGRAFAVVPLVVSRCLSSGMPHVRRRARGSGPASASEASASAPGPSMVHGVATVPGAHTPAPRQ
jgi:hypothetical protein